MALDISRIKALCFDVDGTLRDTDDQWVERLAGRLHPIEFIFPHRDYRRIARKVVMKMDTPSNAWLHFTDRLGLDNLAARMLVRRALRTADTPPVPPRLDRSPPTMVPGVREMLLRLHEYFPMSIISARNEAGTREFLNGHAITALFKVVVGGQTCEFTKPFPDPVLYAARMMDTLPENCLMIGDTIVDIQAGKSAGAQTCGVLCGFGDEKELRHAGADEILESTALLADYLLNAT